MYSAGSGPELTAISSDSGVCALSSLEVPRFLRWGLLLAGFSLLAACTGERGYPDNGSLKVSEDRLDFLVAQDSEPTDQERYNSVEVQSKDGELVNWKVETDAEWLTVSPMEGGNTGEVDEIGVAVDPKKLSPGTHQATITIIENVDSSPRKHDVNVIVRSCAGPCIYVDFDESNNGVGNGRGIPSGRKVTASLFGSQTEYLDSGTSIWDSLVTDDCNNPAIPVGMPEANQLFEVQNIGVGFLRYPSGIPSDFFHWEDAVGPITSRVPQINPWNSTDIAVERECPVFGPDEFVEYADQLDAPIFITTNAGSGTAAEAAGWVEHYQDRGVEAEYWEVGNEIYIDGDDYLFTVHMEPEEYANAFDAHAVAIRNQDPDAKVGLVMAPMDQPWNRAVMKELTQPFDFLTFHSFQPQIDTCAEFSDDVVYNSLFASTLLIEVQIETIKGIVKDFSPEPDREPLFSISEWGPWFLHACSVAGGGVPNNDARARTLGSAVFSALAWNLMLREESLFSAFHSSISSLRAQAIVNLEPSGGTFLPVRTAHYYVQLLYQASIGGEAYLTSTRNSPTFTGKLFDDDLIPVELPVLDSVVVLSEDESQIFGYIANRSLTENLDIQMFLDDIPYPVESVVTDTLSANEISATNTLANPNAVQLVNAVQVAGKDLTVTVPAHSLVRVTINLTK